MFKVEVGGSSIGLMRGPRGTSTQKLDFLQDFNFELGSCSLTTNKDPI